MLKIVFLLVALQVGESLCRAFEDPDNAAAYRAVVNDGLEFSKQFYQVIAKTHTGDLICSPMSAVSALSMVAYGARGDTETALRSGLHFNVDDNIQKRGLKTLFEELNNVPGVELQLANKLFVSNGVSIKSNYQQLTEDIFQSTVQTVDFSKASEAVKTINDWCEDQTNHKIKDVLSSDDIDGATAAVVVNAAYFKGQWIRSFNKNETRDETFHLEDGKTKTLPTMHTERNFNYGVLSDVNARFVELPYKGEQVSMFIILPNEINGLKNLQENFAKLNLHRLFDESIRGKLIFSLPKFEIETEIGLKEPLTDLGMGKIFEPSADLSGMLDKPVAISKAIQKAYIKVDEEGSEAAAISSLIVSFTSANIELPAVEFLVDRPFYYAIIKKINGPEERGIVLFEGHFKGGK